MIKKNNYDFRLNLRKKNEILKLLDSSLKKYLSNEISAKYDENNFPSNYNELIIKHRKIYRYFHSQKKIKRFP